MPAIKRTLTVLALYIVCAGCFVTKRSDTPIDHLAASAMHPFGRSIVNEQQHIELISSACQLGFSFDDTAIQLQVSIPAWLHHNYLQYELDGVYKNRIRIDSSTKLISIAAPAAGKHVIWFYKATEAHTGAVIIQSANAGGIKSLQRPRAVLIEFIGNSITCGAAADASEVPCGTGVYHDQHNAYMAYGPRVAWALGANFIMSSVSGIGIYRNWNNDGPTMPEVYEKADLRINTQQGWNFSTYTPHIVSIALGTNDFSDGDGVHPRRPFDSAAFVNQYIQFVQLVKTKYPSAQIALLGSAMLHDRKRGLLQNCLTAVKEKVDAQNPGGKRVALYFFQPMNARGCTGHPSVEDHEILAKELIPFFKQFMIYL
jgi:hypothetical protein